MENTFQFKNLSIMGHGQSVHEKYLDIIEDLEENKNKYELPPLLRANWTTLNKLLFPTLGIMKTYHVYHDCGKPYCKVVGEDGKQRFPNHADISYQVFNDLFNCDNKETIAKLIQTDMVFHSFSMEDIDTFIKAQPKNFLFSLWLTSMAEIYANKEMFDSDNQLSFKIKYKKLNRILNKILL